MQVKCLLEDYEAELAAIERKLDKVVVPNALAVPQRIARQCRDALASTGASSSAAPASPGDLKALFAKLRGAVEAIPPTAYRAAPRNNPGLYVAPPELEAVVQHVCSGGAGGIAPRPVLLHGAPGLGKSALARALHDRYHAVRTTECTNAPLLLSSCAHCSSVVLHGV
jgi:hypothetical protein